MRMLCQSAPINQRNAADSAAMASSSACALPMDGKFSNDVEQRAGPVSPFSDPQATRPPVASAGRLRPRIPARTAQQWAIRGGALDSERADSHSLRLRGLEAGRQSRDPQSHSQASAGDPARPPRARELRYRADGAAGGSERHLPGAEDGVGAAAQPGEATRSPGIAARALLKLIRIYQATISPCLGNVCRYSPTCSHYAYEAIARQGAIGGTLLALKRLSRCRPWGGNGFDPVPE